MPSTDTKRKPRKPKKNQSLELLRAVTKSMAHAIPGISDESRDVVDDSLARTVSGVASQVMGEDPDTGELVFPPLHNLKRSWNADERRKQGLPRQRRATPGFVADTLSLPTLGEAVGMESPQFATDAAEQAGRIHGMADESMNLDAPVGFRQHAFDSLGSMLGQAPIPGKKKIDMAKDLGGGALQMARKALTAPVEFLSPVVDPSLANYGRGALAGGALGAVADNPEPMMRFIQALDQPIPEDPRIMRPKRRLPDLDFEDLPELTQRAKGGKVGGLKQFLKALDMNPDSQGLRRVPYQIGEPVEEVLYAINEGTRKGVLSGDEAKQIKLLLETGEDEALADALLELHARLKPPPLVAPVENVRGIPERPALDKPNPYGVSEPERMSRGKGMTQEEWDAMLLQGKDPVKKAKGGKVKATSKMGRDLLRLLSEYMDSPATARKMIVDKDGNIDVAKARREIAQGEEFARDTEDELDEAGLGDLDPDEARKEIVKRVTRKPK